MRIAARLNYFKGDGMIVLPRVRSGRRESSENVVLLAEYRTSFRARVRCHMLFDRVTT